MKITDSVWYQKTPLSFILFPLSFIYRAIIFIRHFLYQKNILKSEKISVPVIVVGNITVGGTGKTPLVIGLVKQLEKKGYRPGVILRGYRGKKTAIPILINENTSVIDVGDEAILIANNTKVPVVAGHNRVAAAKKLLSEANCNIIISDDGLQHYALQRDIELAVIDASRGFGNGYCLPAGPLREPISRLRDVQHIVINQVQENDDAIRQQLEEHWKINPISITKMQFVLDGIVNVYDHSLKYTFSELKNKKVIAVAGIGNPNRFFDALSVQGVVFDRKIFPDHYAFSAADFSDMHADIILMTEKDAVKCFELNDSRLWYVAGHAVFDISLL